MYHLLTYVQLCVNIPAQRKHDQNTLQHVLAVRRAPTDSHAGCAAVGAAAAAGCSSSSASNRSDALSHTHWTVHVERKLSAVSREFGGADGR